MLKYLITFLMIKMIKIAEISKIKRRAIKEIQKQIDETLKKYSKEIIADIAKQLPVGQYLTSGNGLCFISDKNDNILARGNAWSRTARGNPKLDFLASLQYHIADELEIRFDIPQTIHGTSPLEDKNR